ANHLTALIRFLTASKSNPTCSHTHRQEPTPSRREVNHRNAPCRCCSLCKSTIAASRTASQRFRSAISGFPLSCGFPGSAAFQYFLPRSRFTRSKFLGGILFPDRTPSSTAISLPFAEISKFAASAPRIFPPAHCLHHARRYSSQMVTGATYPGIVKNQQDRCRASHAD